MSRAAFAPARASSRASSALCSCWRARVSEGPSLSMPRAAVTGSSATGSMRTRRPPACVTMTKSPGSRPIARRSSAGTTTWPFGDVRTIDMAARSLFNGMQLRSTQCDKVKHLAAGHQNVVRNGGPWNAGTGRVGPGIPVRRHDGVIARPWPTFLPPRNQRQRHVGRMLCVVQDSLFRRHEGSVPLVVPTGVQVSVVFGKQRR